MTPLLLTNFINSFQDTSPDKDYYTTLFRFIFQFLHTETQQQPSNVQHQILTNCKSYYIYINCCILLLFLAGSGNTLADFDSDTVALRALGWGRKTISGLWST